jgi:hypothetical protein
MSDVAASCICVCVVSGAGRYVDGQNYEYSIIMSDAAASCIVSSAGR